MSALSDAEAELARLERMVAAQLARVEELRGPLFALGVGPLEPEPLRQLRLLTPITRHFPFAVIVPSGTNEDPTPWCNGCNAARESACDCGPLASNN